jgi:hypothetical protein
MKRVAFFGGGALIICLFTHCRPVEQQRYQVGTRIDLRQASMESLCSVSTSTLRLTCPICPRHFIRSSIFLSPPLDDAPRDLIYRSLGSQNVVNSSPTSHHQSSVQYPIVLPAVSKIA